MSPERSSIDNRRSGETHRGSITLVSILETDYAADWTCAGALLAGVVTVAEWE